ncbi:MULTISPECIES: hypothetical protein [unclassified Nocardia]|uniref:hypothetical protein n=1 Tax=unclassified Nocardia TaxID=2637762 RepID=UPI0033A1D3C5
MYRVADQRPASGGTAVVAAVLALLGGIAGVVGVVFGLYKMVRSETGVFGWGIAPGWVSVVSGATLLVDVVSAVALLVGAILAFRRRAAGPTLVVLGSAGTVGAYVVTAISTAVQLIQYDLPIGRHIDVVLGQSVFNGLYSMERNLPWVVSVLLLVFPVVTFVLAVLPSTKRWCKGGAAQRPPGGAWAPGMVPVAGAPGRPGPGAPQHALHGQLPGAQFVGGAPHPGMRPLLDAPRPGGQQTPGTPYPSAQPTPGAPYAGAQPTPGAPNAGAQPAPGAPYAGAQPAPGAPYAGTQPAPGAPYAGTQPAPGAPYAGAHPVPGAPSVGAQLAPNAPSPDAQAPYPSAPLSPDAQRPDSSSPNQGQPQGHRVPQQDHRPQDGYRA